MIRCSYLETRFGNVWVSVKEGFDGSGSGRDFVVKIVSNFL